MAPLARSYDYVVIGGGSGGAVVASRLAERSDATVLLIEAGPAAEGVAEIDDPGRWVELMRGPYDWGYDYAPTERIDGRVIGIPRGKVLGGSSAINAMLWYRGHPADYDAWAATGATGWDFASVLPFFKRCEDWEGGESAYRGAGGPLRIETPKNPHRIAAALLAAAAELGLPVIADANGADNEGATLANLNVGGGRRWSTARGYLCRHRHNLTILTGSTVLSLGLDGKTCRSVRHLVDGVVVETEFGVEAILAAGAIDTPRLLIASGIGPEAELARLDIPVRVALSGVGQNFQDHPLLMGLNFIAKAPLGPVRDNGGGGMINWKSRDGLAQPDLHAFVVQGRHAGPELCSAYDLGGDCFAISPGLMRSQSRGFLRFDSVTPGGAVEIQPNFLAEPADLDALVDSIDFIMDLAATSAYRDIVLRPASPNRRLTRSEKIGFIRQSLSTFFHCCGSCAMGTSDDAVVDPKLRVHGIEGLRIADASAIPVIPSCNTNAPVVMIAERAADFILEAV